MNTAAATEHEDYWYEHRDELRPGMVFKSFFGIVKLDHRRPGDGTQWIVADYDGKGGWYFMDASVEPGDLTERLPDDYSGPAT